MKDKIKIRYVLKNRNTGKIHYKWYTIEQIEKEGLSNLFDIENYEIISRDRDIGLLDKHGDSIYDRDILKIDEIGSYSERLVEVKWKEWEESARLGKPWMIQKAGWSIDSPQIWTSKSIVVVSKG